MHPVSITPLGIPARTGGAVTLAGLIFMVTLLGSACKDAPICDPELTVGSTYNAKMLEYYTAHSSAEYNYKYAQEDLGWPSCDGFDGLAPGASLSVTITDAYLYHGDCKQLDATVNGLPNGQKWTADSSATVGGGFGQFSVLFAQGRVTSGPCQGKYKVTFGRPSKDVSFFSETKPGEIPSMVLGRSFVPDSSGGGPSCVICADTFVAQLAR